MKTDKQQWLELINEQQQSGLSIAAFCRNKNIKVKYFYYHRTQHIKSNNPSAFIQAKPTRDKRPMDSPASLTLHCGSGQLHLPADVSPVWLASLMKSLA
jgi:hypothetical protein